MAERALTEMGAQLCRSLSPSVDLTEISHWQQETEEAVVILSFTGGNPLLPFPDVKASLTLAEKGATLSPKALLAIAELLRASRTARDVLDTERENTPILKQMALGLCVQRSIEQDITDAILSEDEIADRASRELTEIRRHLRGATERIKARLEQMLRSADFQKYLQDSIITVRNGRYVLPVKAEHRGNVPGLVHDQSTSGATLFIEPMPAVEMGNELKQWESKERQEIQRILAALSANIAPFAEALRETQELLAQLDFIFCKAALSRQMFATAPKLNDQGYLSIVRGRHPLISKEQVVPITLWLGKDFTSLIITGPNTGGKTVTLVFLR